MRVLTERLEGPRRRPHRRDQGLRRARLGAGAARPGRAARPHLRRGRDEEASAELEAELHGLVEEIMQRRGSRPARGANLKLRLTLRRRAASLAAPAASRQKGCVEALPDLGSPLRRRAARPDRRARRTRSTRSPTGGASCTGRSTSCARSCARGCRRQGERASSSQVDVDRLADDPRRQGRPARRSSGSVSHIYCPECGFQNPEAANYCSRCGALLVTRASRRRHDHDASRPRRSHEERAPDARGARHRGPGARRPLRRRPGRRDVRARARPHDDRPLARLRHLPRRRHRLAPPRRARRAATTASRSRTRAASTAPS